MPVPPPRLALRTLRLLAPSARLAELEGDLSEGYNVRLQRQGRLRAWLWSWRQVGSLDLLRLRRILGPPRGSQVPFKRRRLDMVAQHLMDAIRSLRARPMLATAIVLTLAIGSGANTAIFSVVRGILLRPLPYPTPDRLAMVFRTVPRFGFERSPASWPDYADWRAQSPLFSDMAAYARDQRNHRSTEGSERWQGYRVTASFFAVLGVAPELGRAFTDEDDRPGATPVVILPYARWQSAYGATEDILGRVLTLGGEQVTVVGVMPAEFDFPSHTLDYWMPLRADPLQAERDSNYLIVFGRLRPGVSIAAAQTDLTALAARIDREAPDGNQGYGVFIEARHTFVVRNAQRALWVFQAAVGLVLLLACANVANLMLSRATARRREFSLRAALGATRGRMVRQLLTESTLLSLMGGAAGLGVAIALVRVLRWIGTGELPRLEQVRLDPLVLGVTAAAAVGCGLLCGVVPALVTASDLARASKEGPTTTGLGRFGRRLQDGLVVSQVALAMLLSIGAGLLLNSFVRLTNVDPGFDPANVVTARVEAPQLDLPSGPPGPAALPGPVSTRLGFFEDFQRRVAGIPGVSAVGYGYAVPMGPRSFSRNFVPEHLAPAENDEPVLPGNVVAGEYFAALRIPLITGRLFTEADRAGTPLVMVISRTLARRFWPERDPLGTRVRIGTRPGSIVTIVGVVGDTRVRGMNQEPEPVYYRPFAQASWPDELSVIVRTTAAPASVVPLLRRTLWAMDPTLPLTEVATATELIEASASTPRLRTGVLVTFGGFALLLAVVGIYGVIAYRVAAHRREIGVRVALGASAASVTGMVLGRGVSLAVLGTLIGGAAALFATRALGGMLYGIAPTDVPTYAAAAASVVGLAALSSYLPARRAAQVHPVECLRLE